MKIGKRFIINASRIYPKALKKRIKNLLSYAGIKKTAESYLGTSFILSSLFTIAIIIYYLLRNNIGVIPILLSLSVFSATQGIFIIYPYFKSERRARKVEKVLPDFLNLMAANVRSGMTPISSMRSAAKEDFGVLSEEVEDAIAISLGSESYERILNILTENINSVLLNRIVKLLTIGMRTGGRISSLMEGASEEVVRISVLREELVTSVRSYMLFITLVIAGGLPFLLNVSTYFVQTVQGLQTLIDPSELVQSVSTSEISVEFLTILSYVILTATSFFASLLVGSVIDNSMIQGLKYFIPFLVLSLVLFVIGSNVIPNIVGTINIQ